ncbi:helix-turn-helix domain-containing protein [Microbispora sp. CA-135349]|uniref:helix-turn-helix domain-containing protein n=1 Tax=Microbispora sp. CA-135349 TaxID=3239953 RepID=UPI003D92590A
MVSHTSPPSRDPLARAAPGSAKDPLDAGQCLAGESKGGVETADGSHEDGDGPQGDSSEAGDDHVDAVDSEPVELSLDDLYEIEREHAPGTPRDSPEMRRKRLAAERRLVEILRADGFEGERWKKLTTRQLEYGQPIMESWLRTGKIFKHAQRYRRPVYRHTGDYEAMRDDLDQLCADVLLEGLEVFRRALMAGKWNPDRGSTLAEYYIGSCLCGFAKVFHQWWRSRSLNEATDHYGLIPEEAGEYEAHWPTSRLREPEGDAVIQDQISRLMAQAPDDTVRGVLVRRAMGYSQKEAAAAYGLSERAAEGRLRRYRSGLGREGDGPQCDSSEGVVE